MAAAPDASKAAGRVLLPDAAVPSRYDLRLEPDLERFVFDAKVRITLEVREAVSDLTLHSKELQILSATFVPAEADASTVGAKVSGDAIDALTITQNMKKNTVAFGFPEVLPVGLGFLDIEYVGQLNNQMAGFYRSSYKDIHGNSKIMASTQFESLDARRCLPCWDEPSSKAVFAVTLVVDPALTAFSNMPEASSRQVTKADRVKKEVAFMDSPKMSTYLLAFVVGEFDFVQKLTAHGVLVRVYAPPGRAGDGEFALDIAAKSLDLYDDFFGVPFPLPKLDMVAIPEFAMGAMENWGLVTYREVDLLINPQTASNEQKQRVGIVVTHELAHQWFGNLVTMAWWDDLWLNEGFASWTENYALDIICPDYRLWDQFSSDTLAAALRLDALRTSHPIQVPIAEAEEVEEVFDAISYCKGAAVVRMAHAVIGHEAFQKGLNTYMNRHKYSNTETYHLWNAWSESSGSNIKEMMSSWTEQMGFPLVTVKEFTASGGVAKMKLEQTWFLASGEEPSPSEEKTWTVPLFLRTSAEATKPAILMTSKTFDLEVPIKADGAGCEYVLINQGQFTPMRVSYTPEMRERLVKAIVAGNIPAADRAGLVMDAYALAKAGKLGTHELLRFLGAFRSEVDYVVWEALAQVLNGLQKVFMGGTSAEVCGWYMSFAEKLVWKAWEASGLGWEAKATDGHLGGMMRGLLMKLVSKFSPGQSFLAEAQRRFSLYVLDPKENAINLPDEYRVPVFQTVLKQGGEEEYTTLMETFKKLTANVDQKHVFTSIGYAQSLKHKEKALRWAISGDIKIQDFFYIIGSVAVSSKAGLDLTWDFFKREISGIRTLLKSASPSIMDAVIAYSTSGYCSTSMASEIEKFFEENPFPSNKRKISQVLEEIRGNASFVDRILATEVTKAAFWSGLDEAASKL